MLRGPVGPPPSRPRSAPSAPQRIPPLAHLGISRHLA